MWTSLWRKAIPLVGYIFATLVGGIVSELNSSSTSVHFSRTNTEARGAAGIISRAGRSGGIMADSYALELRVPVHSDEVLAVPVEDFRCGLGVWCGACSSLVYKLDFRFQNEGWYCRDSPHSRFLLVDVCRGNVYL